MYLELFIRTAVRKPLLWDDGGPLWTGTVFYCIGTAFITIYLCIYCCLDLFIRTAVRKL